MTAQSATVDELLTGRENLRMIGRLYGLTARDVRTISEELLERFSLTDAGDKVVNIGSHASIHTASCLHGLRYRQWRTGEKRSLWILVWEDEI